MALIERGRAQMAVLETTDELSEEGRVMALAMQRTALARREQLDLPALEAALVAAEERDALQAGRPDGCLCLGLGGRGHLVLLGARPIWSEFCGCPDGLALLAAADQARAEEEAEEARRRGEEERRALERETAERLARAYLPPRLERWRFSDFDDARDKAAAVARMACFGSATRQRGVLLHGDFGTGKSTLGGCALRAWVEAGGSGLYVTLSDYLDWLRPPGNRLAPAPFGALERLPSAGLVVLDDIGLERLTRWGYEQVFRLVNGRYEAQRPTIYTSNYDPDELVLRLTPDGEDPLEGRRIVERIVETCDVIRLKGRNFRERPS